MINNYQLNPGSFKAAFLFVACMIIVFKFFN
jgi:hypothetical protein